MKALLARSLAAFAVMAVAGSLTISDTVAADVDKLVENCGHCHGKDGASTEPTVPIIGGISEYYMIDNMAAYKDEARPCPEAEYHEGPDKGSKTDMCKIAAKLSDEDIEALAKFYAAKPFVRAKQDFDAAKAEHGKKIHDANCEKCHEDGGASAEDDAGILAGQWTQYLEHTFKVYESGERAMPKKMKPKFEKLDAADKEALLNYYRSLH